MSILWTQKKKWICFSKNIFENKIVYDKYRQVYDKLREVFLEVFL